MKHFSNRMHLENLCDISSGYWIFLGIRAIYKRNIIHYNIKLSEVKLNVYL